MVFLPYQTQPEDVKGQFLKNYLKPMMRFLEKKLLFLTDLSAGNFSFGSSMGAIQRVNNAPNIDCSKIFLKFSFM
ncbi:hypothetical protein HYU94_02125 [Candidatus Daviesbacteria bacterium]|nr:hypothetical protein [Candidatus Daviesbacteria bacterium]